MIAEDVRTIVEQHRVLAGVVWLDHPPVDAITAVWCAVNPDGIWVLLRPGRDYGLIDRASGHLYVSALVGTLIEIEYTTAERQP